MEEAPEDPSQTALEGGGGVEARRSQASWRPHWSWVSRDKEPDSGKELGPQQALNRWVFGGFCFCPKVDFVHTRNVKQG